MKQFFFSRLLALATIVTFSLSAFAAEKNDAPLPKISKPGIYQGYTQPLYKNFKYTSYYIPTRDTVLLATDVFLPKHLEKGKKIPTILYLTRYIRSLQAKFPFNLIMDPVLTQVSQKEVNFFTSYGYAVVVVDVRGTGASLGARGMEFSPEEIADGKDVVDWIIAQPWSSGNVGTTGVSYLGTTAEMLLANKHPNVKACIPRSAIFDLYDDMIFPGGVCEGDFINIWGATTSYLDQNDWSHFGKRARLVRSAHPVRGDKKRARLNEAIALHKKNFNVSTGLENISYRDDLQQPANKCINDFSVHNRLKQIEASGTPIYRIDGWYDGGLAKGCIDASLNTSNTKKVLIGPWDHGPQNDVSPYATSKLVKFNVRLEMLRFFDHYLKNIDNGIDKEPEYTYYTVGEEIWKTTTTWPPVEQKPLLLFLSDDKTLVDAKDKLKPGTVNYNIDYTTTSGPTARWNSLTSLFMHGHTDYPDRRKEDEKLLTFNSPKLPSPIEITGHPLVELYFAADADDATVFCYLEDVGPDSSVTYITEGSFRPADRKVNDNATYKTPYLDHSYCKADAEPYKKGETVLLTFDLQPISYQLKKDHQLRLSIAGADIGHFTLPSPKPTTFTISSNKERFSFLEVPVMSKK